MTPFEDAILHSLKYSGQDVYGVMMTKTSEPEICVPLFHTPCISRPLLRTAFSLLDQLEGYRIVAVYFASNVESVVPPLAHLIAGQVSAALGTPVPLWRLGLTKVSTSDGSSAVKVSCYNIDSGKGAVEKVIDIDSIKLKEQIQNEGYIARPDFEDFLQDPTAEWIRT